MKRRANSRGDSVDVTIGTFNLNNLFTRFNLYVEAPREEAALTPPRPWLEAGDAVAAVPEDDLVIEVRRGRDGAMHRWRTFKGKVVFGKSARARDALASRLAEMDLDVVCVQEVENLDALEEFARHPEVAPLGYRHVVLVEGNDTRLIDVGVLSRLPVGEVASWRFRTHREAPEERVFSRDLLQVDIMSKDRRRRLVTVFNNHLKSKLALGMTPEERAAETAAADERRRRQAETVAAISRAQRRGRYVVIGDMNDTPDAATLRAYAENGLANGLTRVEEGGGPYPDDDPTVPAPGTPWTHRFKESGQPPRYELFDHIWLSPDLAARQQGAFVHRRTTRGGDGSDHDPAWVTLDL
jgi:endonuclease/exonuclease/phosphatase family metal-dependent hydrolase